MATAATDFPVRRLAFREKDLEDGCAARHAKRKFSIRQGISRQANGQRTQPRGDLGHASWVFYCLGAGLGESSYTVVVRRRGLAYVIESPRSVSASKQALRWHICPAYPEREDATTHEAVLAIVESLRSTTSPSNSILCHAYSLHPPQASLRSNSHGVHHTRFTHVASVVVVADRILMYDDGRGLGGGPGDAASSQRCGGGGGPRSVDRAA